jgi:anaerobic selenocysteine-containing dehydrogenase
MHPDDAAREGVTDGQRVEIGNARGEIVLPVKIDAGTKPGVLIHEGLWPNGAFERGEGINVLTGADPAAPFGGAAFHDNKVWIRPV